MNILLFADNKNEMGQKFISSIDSIVDRQKIEICETILSLAKRFRLPTYCLDAVVLIIEDENQFVQILTLKELLSEARLLLILPEDNERIVTEALTLFPSFISFLDQDWFGVREVLEKINSKKGLNRKVLAAGGCF